MIKFILIEKDGTATVKVSKYEKDSNWNVFNEIESYVGEFGVERPTKIKDIFLMHDDFFGSNSDKDFVDNDNLCASAISGHDEYSTCVLCRIVFSDNDENADEIVSLTDEDISNIKEYCVENNINLNWKEETNEIQTD